MSSYTSILLEDEFYAFIIEEKDYLVVFGSYVGNSYFFATYFYNSTRKLMSQSEKNLETIITKSIAQEIQDNLDFTESNVKSVVENPKVQELFAKRDREGLYKYLLPKL